MIVNQYSRVVGESGNELAMKLLNDTFVLKSANWRGVGVLPNSRLVLNDAFRRFDAEAKFGIRMPETSEMSETQKHSCICGEVLKGVSPNLCPNFGTACTPASPKGPCMVTGEGSCSIAYRNRQG